jgi:hypothetical protein
VPEEAVSHHKKRKLILGFDGKPHGSLSVVDGELHAEGPEPHAVWHHAECAAHALARSGDASKLTPDGILDHLAANLRGRAHAHWEPDDDDRRADWTKVYGAKMEKGFDADDHPREKAAHDGKKPGEFAPNGNGKRDKTDPRDLPPNPLPRVDADTETAMENALRKAAAPDTVKEFIGYSATEERVPISSLSSPQTVMNLDAVNYFLDNPDELDEAQPLPLVIQWGDRMVLRDGNGRAVAASKLNRDKIKARVVYVPEG